MISKLAVIESAHTMQPLQATHLFTFGLPASPISLSLEGLVLQYLKQASQSVQRVEEVSPLSSGPTCSSSPDDATALLTEMGDYLTRTAMIWAYLIENLIKGPHIDHVTLQILENSRAKTNVADLTEATSLDITLGRLRCVYLLYFCCLALKCPYNLTICYFQHTVRCVTWQRNTLRIFKPYGSLEATGRLVYHV